MDSRFPAACLERETLTTGAHAACAASDARNSSTASTAPRSSAAVCSCFIVAPSSADPVACSKDTFARLSLSFVRLTPALEGGMVRTGIWPAQGHPDASRLYSCIV